MKVIGLTGGIATGKSTASRYLVQNGLPVLDADQMAREVVEPGMPALADLVAAFGEDILLVTGELNRMELGRRVFSDPQALKQLNQITHPRIRERLFEHLKYIGESKNTPAVVIDAALIFETGWDEIVDEVWLLVVSEETQRERLKQRSKVTEEQARAMMASQMPASEKMKRAKVWIDNNGSVAALYHQLDELVNTII
jgi:dephospho-CoA kinase